VCRQLSVVCAFSEVIVMRCCGLWWEECVQCVIRIVQSLAEQPVIRLFQQLVKVWQIRRTVAAASQKRVDSLDIGRSYEVSPCGPRLRQPWHHDCPRAFLKDQFRTAGGSNSMASAEREPITGVWGRSPQGGPGGRAPGGRSGGEAPLKLNAFLFLRVQRKLQICPIINICKSQ